MISNNSGLEKNCWRAYWLRQWDDLEWTRAPQESPLFLVLVRHFLRRGNWETQLHSENICLLSLSPGMAFLVPISVVTALQVSSSMNLFLSPKDDLFSLSLNSKRSTLSSFQDLFGGNSEIKVFCHPGGPEEILGIGRKALKKLKSRLFNSRLERVYEVQSGKHF